MTFDEESRALYDAVAPTYPQEHFEKLLAEIEATGTLKPKDVSDHRTLSQRYDDWHKDFIIPKDELDSVFQFAIKECTCSSCAPADRELYRGICHEQAVGQLQLV